MLPNRTPAGDRAKSGVRDALYDNTSISRRARVLQINAIRVKWSIPGSIAKRRGLTPGHQWMPVVPPPLKNNVDIRGTLIQGNVPARCILNDHHIRLFSHDGSTMPLEAETAVAGFVQEVEYRCHAGM